MKNDLTQLVRSQSATIQAAILLPQATPTVKGKISFVLQKRSEFQIFNFNHGCFKTCFILDNNVEKGVLLQKLNEVGSTYGTIQFPPMLTPVPAKPTLFDIAGDKGTDQIYNVSVFL